MKYNTIAGFDFIGLMTLKGEKVEIPIVIKRNCRNK